MWFLQVPLAHVTPRTTVLYLECNWSTVVLTGLGKGKCKGTVQPLMEVFHDTATECHLPYGITQCYLLPDTSKHTRP